jgi:hypothetical protein
LFAILAIGATSRHRSLPDKSLLNDGLLARLLLGLPINFSSKQLTYKLLRENWFPGPAGERLVSENRLP